MKPTGYVTIKKDALWRICHRIQDRIKREQEEAVKKIEDWHSKASRWERILSDSKKIQIDRAKWGSEGMLGLVEELIRLTESPHIEESLLLSIERMALLQAWDNE